jgi:hypothetical protein
MSMILLWLHEGSPRTANTMQRAEDFVLYKALVNPWRMREGYSSHFVWEWVCVSVTTLPATYLISMSQMRCYKAPYRVSIVCIA